MTKTLDDLAQRLREDSLNSSLGSPLPSAEHWKLMASIVRRVAVDDPELLGLEIVGTKWDEERGERWAFLELPDPD
jgi:hypothetical protein